MNDKERKYRTSDHTTNAYERLKVVKARRDQPDDVCDPHKTYEHIRNVSTSKHIHSYEQRPLTSHLYHPTNELMNRILSGDFTQFDQFSRFQ